MMSYGYTFVVTLSLPMQTFASFLSCMYKADRCPSKDDWNAKNVLYNCRKKWQYVCMLGNGSVLYEGCMPNSTVQFGSYGCPFIEQCDKNFGWPLLSHDKFISCDMLDRCPPRNHSDVSVFQLKDFPECYTLREEVEGTSIPSTLSIIPQENTNNATVLILVCFMLIIAIAAIAITLFILYRKKKLKCGRHEEDAAVSSPEASLPLTKEPCEDEVLASSSEAKGGFSLSEVPIGRYPTHFHDFSFSNDLPDGEVDDDRMSIHDDVKIRRSTSFKGDTESQWIHYCMRITDGQREPCGERPEYYCDTCLKRNLFCRKCAKKHFDHNKDHGIIPYVNFGQRCAKHRGIPLKRWCSECKVYLCHECVETHDCKGPLLDLKTRLKDLTVKVNIIEEKKVMSIDFLKIDIENLQAKENALSRKTKIYEGTRSAFNLSFQREKLDLENTITEIEDVIKYSRNIVKRQNIRELEDFCKSQE